MPLSSLKLSAGAILSALLLASTVQATAWTQTENISGKQYFTSFDWFTDRDPTNGLVNYQSLANAQSQRLSYVNSSNKFIMAVSTTPVALEGRNSVRIQSKKAYSDGVYVLDVNHVPTGCSTWPAFWTVTQDLSTWPRGGEIDIMENANDEYTSNVVTAHTQSDCTVSGTLPKMTGQLMAPTCSAYVNYNTGCQAQMNGGTAPTWGSKLNAAGGGLIAMERSFGTGGKGVRVWYFPKGRSLPSDLASGSRSVEPENWGTPAAVLPIQKCYADFAAHKIIFDITLCGDWAANTYERAGCTKQFEACSWQVGYAGQSYSEAYWKVGALRVYTNGGGKKNAALYPQGK